MVLKKLFLILIFNFLFSDELHLTNGSILKGKIIEKSEESVSISIKFSDSNEQIILVNISEIEKIIYDDSDLNSKYLYNDPNKSRYFFSPSAFEIGGGETYFRNTWVFFSSFGRGLSDHLSVEGGMSIFPGGDLENQIKLFSLKVNSSNYTDLTNLRFAAGVFYIGVFEGGSGFIFGTSTLGESDDNFSISLGLGYSRAEGNVELARDMTIILCRKQRLSKSIALISENWLIPGVDQIFSNTGIRFFGKNLSADFSGIFLLSEYFGMPMPMLSISYRF